MLQVARLAPQVLGESTELVSDYLLSQHRPEGGFCDRQGKPDLYYTIFGVGGLLALQRPLPVEPLARFLSDYGDGAALQLVDFSCLIRAWASLPIEVRPHELDGRLIQRLEQFRTPDGGYAITRGESNGTVYGCFLALGIAQDLGATLPDPEGVLKCVDGLRTSDGAYANGQDMRMGLVPPTAAAVAIHRHLNRRSPDGVADWLFSRLHPEGGFVVAEGAVIPDLLSTATALHALDSLQADLRPVKDLCLDFIDTLWTARGGFHGTWEDDHLDVEYTYYGLLALGHLSL